jgi:hypothetical protein
VIFGTDLKGSSVIAPRPDTCFRFRVTGVNPGSLAVANQPRIIDVLVALGEKLAPKLRNFARDRQDSRRSLEDSADGFFDLVGNVALVDSELAYPFSDFADRECAYRKVGVIDSIQPGGDVRIRFGLADLAEHLASMRNVISPRPGPYPTPPGRHA